MFEALPFGNALLLKVNDLDRHLQALKANLDALHPNEIAALEASEKALIDEIRITQDRLAEALETLHAIRTGKVDALVVQGPQGEQVYTLKGADEPYRVMVETMTEGAVTFSLDGTILYCNARFAEFLKLSLELVIGSTLQNFITPQERSTFEALVAESRYTPIRREISLQAADGASLRAYFSTHVLKEDKLEAIAAVVTDLTDIVAAQEALNESEDKFRHLFEYSPIGKSLTSMDGVMYINKAFCDMLGYTEKELQNQKWQSITHPDDIELSQRVLDKLISGEKKYTNFIKRYLNKTGAIVWADEYIFLRRDPAGTPQYFMINVVDITERKRSQDELNRLNAELEMRVLQRTAQLTAANRELEAFAYSVSHDLRAPLRSIDGFSLALLEEYADKLDAEGKDFLQRVRAASQRMGQLIDDLLNLSHITRIEMTRAPVDLSAFARQIAAALQEEQPNRKVEFVIQDGIIATGDGRLLQVLLENLIGNAWKYTGKHASARIEFGQTDASGKNVYFVRDDGAGFNMEYAEKLFFPFQRLHSGEEFPGNGIGLAIVQRIVNRHGGAVWGEGAVEQGATFYFRLD